MLVEEGWVQQTVADVMDPCSATVRVSATVAEAALKMLNGNVRELLVVDESGCLVGLIRARDLFSISNSTIGPGVRPARVVVSKGTSPLEAIRMMHKTGDTHAVVVDGEKVVGVFTWQDALDGFVD